MTDPRFTDPLLNGPMTRRDERTSRRDEKVGEIMSLVFLVLLLLLVCFLILSGSSTQ
jgi:hypothetical protein